MTNVSQLSASTLLFLNLFLLCMNVSKFSRNLNECWKLYWNTPRGDRHNNPSIKKPRSPTNREVRILRKVKRWAPKYFLSNSWLERLIHASLKHFPAPHPLYTLRGWGPAPASVAGRSAFPFSHCWMFNYKTYPHVRTCTTPPSKDSFYGKTACNNGHQNIFLA